MLGTKKSLRAAGVLVAAALLATGCSRAPSPKPRSVRAGLYSPPVTLSLLGSTDRTSALTARLITDSLLEYDASLHLSPRVAESWEVNPKTRTVLFHLRAGVTWQDGTPVTARDVVFTVNKARDPATRAGSYFSQFEDLESVEAPNDRTVRVVYRRLLADFLEAWTVPLIPAHLAGKDADLLTGDFSRHPVGCGPFRFVSYEPDRRLVLEAYDRYWDGRPNLDRLVLEIVPDDRTAYQALVKGDLDLVTVTPDLWRESRDAATQAGFRRMLFYRLHVYYIGWNQDGSNPFFTDARVRRAMMMALDRERFIRQVTGGLAIPAATTYHPRSPWADPSVQPWPYDPGRARDLLRAAGWTDTDGDGIRDRNGIPFSFRLLIPASRQEITNRMAAWIQDSLHSVGLDMKIDRLEWGAFQERRRAHRFQAAMASLSFTPIPDQYELYHSSARKDGYNYVGLADPEVDRLLEEGRREFDTARRRAIYFRLQQRLHELEPLGCLFHFASPVLYRNGLEGLKPCPLGLWAVTPGPRAWHWAGAGGGD